MVTIEVDEHRIHCPHCSSKLMAVPGIGMACLHLICPVSDGWLEWLYLSGEERQQRVRERLKECRRYKAAGNPNFKDLDI